MSGHREIRALIAGKLRSIVTEPVYEFERFAATEKTFRALYQAGETLAGWHIRRTGRREDAENNEVFTEWEMRGVRALDDSAESELLLDDQVDLVLAAFRSDPTLGRKLIYPKSKDDVVPQLADSGPVMFCGVLCHAVKLKYTTRTAIDTDRPWD